MLWVCVGLGLSVGACANLPPNATATPPPLPPGGGAPFVSDAEAVAARQLYVAKCARCHKFYSPAKYSSVVWHSWMDKMSRKAKLKPAQEELLARYLEVFRQPGDPNSGPSK